MEVESKGPVPLAVRTAPARVPAGGSSGRVISDTVARSLEQRQAAIDIRTGLADARRAQAENQVANLKAQADKLRVLSLVAPSAFADYVDGLSRQLSFTVSAYAQGGDPAAIRQEVRNLAEWVVSVEDRGIGIEAAASGTPAGQADTAGQADATATAGPDAAAGAATPSDDGASWQDLVAQTRAWLAEDDARLADSRRNWFATARSTTPEQAQDRILVKEAREVQLRLETLFTVALSGIEDGEAARAAKSRHGRTTDRLNDALDTIDGWAHGRSTRLPPGGLSILA